ncbi:MAG: PHP domain-containing protein [Bdellovibrionaceae bacterium]|nr:PHP domain-containing protein [Bdellovibrionales bacterium]MCB9085345.1 PHP domain-containing protein [Pseudobdellovibrionaceae bacterium]
MKKWLFLSCAVLAFITYGLIISQWSLRIVPAELSPGNPEGFYDYRGVTNIHSNLSTGSRDLAEVIRVAQDSGLDFVFFSDLNTSEKPQFLEGYHGNLLVFIDGEYSYLNSRVLNYDSSDPSDLSSPGRSQLFLADQLTQSSRDSSLGIFVLAHPFKPNFRWEGEIPLGFDGIEIINLKSIWQQSWLETRASFLWTLFLYPFNNRLALIRLFQIPDAELELWDKLNQRKKVIGFAGTDAEARVRISPERFIEFPSYLTLFSLVRNHVLLPSELTGNADDDRQKLAGAIRRGQFYMSLDSLADPRGFIAKIDNDKTTPVLMGGSIDWSPGLRLTTVLPQKPNVPFDVIYYRNGEKVLVSNSRETSLEIPSPGVYRVMVRVIPTLPLPDGKKWIPWIFTNPFYINAPGESE